MKKFRCLTSYAGLLPLILAAAFLLAGCTQPPGATQAPAVPQEATALESAVTPAEAPAGTPGAPATGAPATQPPTGTEAPAATEGPPATPAEPTPTGVPAGGEVIQPENAPEVEAITGVRLPETRLFAWLPDSQGVAVASESEIIFYGLNPLKANRRFNAPAATNLELSPDGGLLAWAGEDNAIHLWSAATGQELFTLSGRSAGLNDLEFSPDGKMLAVATPDNTVELWDTATAGLLKTWTLAFWVTGLDFSPDGALLAGVELDNFTTHVFQVPGGDEQRALSWTEHASPALYGARFTPDWSTLVWWSRGTVQLMDAAGGELGATLGHEDFISALAISPQGGLLASAAAGTLDGQFVPAVFLWDLATGESLNQLAQEGAVTGLEFSPDGRTLAILTFDNVLRFWEVPEPGS